MSLQINNNYTFNTLAPAILGAIVKNAKLIQSCSFESAMKEENVAVKYEQIYPALPEGTPRSPKGVIFHRFITESGEKVFFAEPWIDNETLVVVTSLNFNVTVVNATSQDRENVRRALAHLNVNFTIDDL